MEFVKLTTEMDEIALDPVHSLRLPGDGERIDDLMYKGFRILQKTDAFCFGTDSVLLADFAAPKPGDRVVDLGTGTGILSILMAARQERADFDAVEIQAGMAEMASRSVRMNGLGTRIAVYHGDLRDAPKHLGYGKHTLVVCNPPYSPEGTALASESDTKRLARHEGGCTIADIAKSASALLKNGGRIKLIYPSPRAFDLMCALRDCRLEPKSIQVVQARPSAAPKFILLDAVMGGGSMLHWFAAACAGQ